MNVPELKLTERDDVLPKCPYCQTDLKEVYVRKQGIGIIVSRCSVFFCPTCHKVLGFGESRMM